MARINVISEIWQIATDMRRNGYDYQKFNKIFEKASDWNRENEGEEIFVAVYDTENEDEIQIYVEDDYVIVEC